MADLAKLVEEKNKQRLALKKEYFKLLTDPDSTGKGHVFDPAFQQHNAMRVTRINHFRETPKNALRFIVVIALPLTATVYLIKNSRDKNEAEIRSGNVAYKDRQFRFQ